MKLSGELNYRIHYDVEHDLFHAQNVFNDEYITPTFIEYVQKLEKENKTLRIHQTNAVLEGLEMEVLKNSHRDRANNLQVQFTKAKKIIKTLLRLWNDVMTEETVKALITEAEQFLNEVEK